MGSWGEFPPARFDDYEVVRPLATGGMGTVFLGRDLLLDRPVALKFIASADPDQHAYDRFVAEARALARVHHPNVVGVYRISAVTGRPYIAYEFVDGVPLHRLRRPVAWREVVHIGLGLARGLAAVHASGLLHRDLKPSNAVVARDQVKLIDFGLAQNQPSEADDDDDDESPAPQRPEVRPWMSGTPVYMAPELASGTPASARSDLYSLGLILWELLAGDLPRGDGPPEETMGYLLTQGLPPIGEMVSDLPSPLATLVDQCTQYQPDRRPRTAAVVRDRLETLRAVYAPLVGDFGDDALVESRAASRLTASLARVTGTRDFAARCFRRLFAAAPGLRPLFPDDLSEHREQLVSALHTVIGEARSPEVVVPLLEDLGHRLHTFGVREDHFTAAGRALLDTLAELDDSHWTPALANLWARTFQRIASHVRRGLTRAMAQTSGLHVIGGSVGVGDGPPPEPRYTSGSGALLAYQIVGDGPRDVVVVPGWVSHLELGWLDSGYAQLIARLARRARTTLYDRRGTGLSERTLSGLDLSHQVADLLAVLDAAAIDRATLFAWHDSAATALMAAATHPERVRALALWAATPSLVARPGFDHAPSRAELDGWIEEVRDHWGEPVMIDQLAPSRRDDEAFRAWWARYLRSGTTPAAIAAIVRAQAGVDLRGLLPAVRVPTLVVRRRDDPMVPAAATRELAACISGARVIELDGDDHLPYASAAEVVAAEVEAFFCDLPTATELPVRLVTVLAIEPGDDPDLRRLHHAMVSEQGVIVDDRRGPVALFRTPAAALRALRAASPGSSGRAAIVADVVPIRGGHEADLIETAWNMAGAALPGRLHLPPAVLDLVGDSSLTDAMRTDEVPGLVTMSLPD